ncbi:hypothetical protein [Shewanella aestuarii]|uniref:Uncharacterized protein n=1 Tax=Shewanella aestuarii TaxID=1028752 RepID=A0A6G9QPE1_9GAMM|nr:hypothetical protein [Shewanella aestuarii]QIR15699.1 hypothetical protein HBH39_15400 [Shewanella aestuarii]
MKKSLLAAALLFTAFNVSANVTPAKDIQEIDQVMSQLVTVHDDVEVIITSSETENFEYIEIDTFVHESLSEIYVSHDQAKELQLEKNRHFYLYSADSLEKMAEKLVERIQKDDPKYFSVHLFRKPVGYGRNFEYVAKVVEYK